MSLLRQLLTDAGFDPSTLPRNTVAGQIMASDGVYGGQEFERIKALPRRVWQDRTDLDKLVRLMSEWLRVPGSNAQLYVVQAIALQELHDLGRLNLVGNVGVGKTLCGFLAPVVLGSLRPLWITYKSLIEKTQRDLQRYAEDWKVHREWKYLGAEALSRDYDGKLDRLEPDLIVVDECFVEDTQIQTPAGETPIKDLLPGAFVDTVAGIEEIIAVSVRTVSETVEVTTGFQTVVTTPNHPFLTECGWIHAKDLSQADWIVCRMRQTGSSGEEMLQSELFLDAAPTRGQGNNAVLSGVWRPLSLQGEHVLQSILFSQESVSSRCSSDSCTRGFTESASYSSETKGRRPRTSREVVQDFFRTYAAQQSNAYGRCPREGEETFEGDWPSTSSTWREWSSFALSASEYAASFGGGLDTRVRHFDGRDSSCNRESEPLQDRHSPPRVETSDRARRIFTSGVGSSGTGPEKRCMFGTLGLARVSGVQFRYGATKVYNLHVSGSNTYIANNLVVHNCHLLKDPASGRSKKIKRYLKSHPECVFIPMTGTPGDDKVENFAHIQSWALGEGSPLPRTYNETLHWGQALNANVNQRRAPGVLIDLEENCPKETLDDVRAIVGRRIEQTPGNVYHRVGEVSCSLYLDAIVYDEDSKDAEFEAARSSDMTPDGRVYEEAVELHRILQTMALGFWHLIDPPPPKEWRDARRAWGQFVRDVIAHNRQGWDTPLQVARVCHRGELKSSGVYENWHRIQPTFKPNRVIAWFDDKPLERVAEWLEKERELVWTPYPAVGEKLARMTGVPFFHQLGESKTHGSIETYRRGPAILSIGSNTLGRNLQDRWHRNLILSSPGKSDQLNQIIGRTHRRGQKADDVTATFFCGVLENLEAIHKARARAEYDRDMGRNLSNKLLECDWLIPELFSSKRKGPRWER